MSDGKHFCSKCFKRYKANGCYDFPQCECGVASICVEPMIIREIESVMLQRGLSEGERIERKRCVALAHIVTDRHRAVFSPDAIVMGRSDGWRRCGENIAQAIATDDKGLEFLMTTHEMDEFKAARDGGALDEPMSKSQAKRIAAMKKPSLVSKCCSAPLQLNYGAEATSYYNCTKCGKPCDVKGGGE